ncbi:MAG: HD domain-containing protein [Cyanobacteria bacterium P01_H01_bin.58]
MQDTWSVVLKALQFAAHKHRHQRRKDPDSTPYINHPISLLHLLHNEAAITDSVVLAGALLHDTVEDTDTLLSEIEHVFGADVADVVAQVTDDKSLPKAVRKQLQIDHAAALCDRAKLVKLADKACNLRDLAQSPPAGWSPDRVIQYREWCRQVVDQLRGTHMTLEALFDQAYAEAHAVSQPH